GPVPQQNEVTITSGSRSTISSQLASNKYSSSSAKTFSPPASSTKWLSKDAPPETWAELDSPPLMTNTLTGSSTSSTFSVISSISACISSINSSPRSWTPKISAISSICLYTI